ncbi:MAG TPA: CbiX/SirB N-terminal domain-containing protein [Desulfitobacteriaceae bacterium]|nr:CbiX/SirB N-terminal domain-containing protein [Desulfitobacteriaceae bacterium]
MQTEYIILGHGSRRKEANEGFLEVARKVTKIMEQDVTPAFMAHSTPVLPEVIMEKIQLGAGRIIIMPLFLFRGIHVSEDIDKELSAIRAKYPRVQIIITPELGADDAIAQLAGSRIKEALLV